jgi:regulator of cell morphogenesis and NO signaling
MTTTTGTTISDFLLEYPQATEVFERLKIDYCCGGNRSLDEACVNAGVDVEKLLAMLSQTSRVQGEQAFDPLNTTLTELINHIMERHHVYTNREMSELPGLFEKVLSAHGANHPELVQAEALFSILCDELKPHMFKEEQILFPYLLNMDLAVVETRPRLPSGTVSNPISIMNEEHDGAGDLLRDLREATSDYHIPADACPSYRNLYERLATFEKDLHQHIHLENNILFRRAVELEGSPRGQ